MKLYQSNFSPNSRRVRIYLAEKQIQVPCVEVDIRTGASHTPEYLKRNPMGEVPALELDDGQVIAESIAICRYFEALHRHTALFGTTAQEIATIEMWQRRIELKWFGPLVAYWHHSAPSWAGRVKQIPELAAQNRGQIINFCTWLDGEMADREYIAGREFTIADILGLVAFDHGVYVGGFEPVKELKNLERWRTLVASRPGAGA